MKGNKKTHKVKVSMSVWKKVPGLIKESTKSYHNLQIRLFKHFRYILFTQTSTTCKQTASG